MKTRALFVSLFAVIALVGCGKKGPSTSAEVKEAASSPSAGAASAAPAAAPASAPAAARTVEITANDQMKFSVATIDAKPGESLHVVLKNVGSMPKQAMGHNWLLLKAGADGMAFATAAAGAIEQNYIPPAMADQVLAKIDLLGPKQSGEVTFNAPAQPGEYPFICSFPGHYMVGMKGVLVVQ